LAASRLDGLVLLHKITVLCIEIFVIVTLIGVQGIVIFFFFSFPIIQIPYILIGWWLISRSKIIFLSVYFSLALLLGIDRFLSAHFCFPCLLGH